MLWSGRCNRDIILTVSICSLHVLRTFDAHLSYRIVSYRLCMIEFLSPISFHSHYIDLLPEGFTPAPRETEADKSGDIQTLNRQLKTRVYLSIRNNDAQGWHLPTASLKEDETFLDGAKRATEHVAGDELILRCFSNCPMGIDVVEYSDEEKENNGGFFGEKIFYMRVQHEDGDVKTSKVSKMEDWGWLAREEMVEKVTAEKRDEAALFYKYML
jgi:hypothetical protein